MKNKIDPTTWTDNENLAANYLADTLTEISDNNLTHKVNNYFHKFTIRMKALNSLEKDIRCFYLSLLFDKTRSEINSKFTHEKVKSLLLNVVSATYRKELIKIKR
jgi:hypothetical protein